MNDDTEPRLEPRLELVPTEGELIEPSRRAINSVFRKGQSGNPGGVAKAYYRARRIFMANSEAMTERLIYLSLNAEDERVSAMCTIAGLGIAGLRPKDYDPKDNDESVIARLNVDRWTPEQRAQALALLDAAMGPKEAEE